MDASVTAQKRHARTMEKLVRKVKREGMTGFSKIFLKLIGVILPSLMIGQTNWKLHVPSVGETFE